MSTFKHEDIGFEPGSVWLVGAGPGDPELLTLIAAKALAQADVIIHDALVNPAILKMARTGALIKYAGKRGGKPSPSQRDISLTLIEFARAGNRVLRLKGGDPLVFGRGGEEALALVEAGIGFRIVPGISAGVGGLAYAGIPLTHRDVNHTVTFLTGHDSSGLVPDRIDWQAVANASPVIVMYMAMKHWDHIRDALLSAGRPSEDPVAFVVDATTERQQVLETTLERSLFDLEQTGLRPPAIVIVGEAVRLRSGLDWQGQAQGKVLDSDPLEMARNRETG